MSDEKNVTMTQRERVEELRDAFFQGTSWQNSYEATARRTAKELNPDSTLVGRHCGADVIAEAGRRYPLPKLKRPRVVTTPNGRKYRIADGQIETSIGTCWSTMFDAEHTAAIRAALADPLEEVEAE